MVPLARMQHLTGLGKLSGARVAFFPIPLPFFSIPRLAPSTSSGDAPADCYLARRASPPVAGQRPTARRDRNAGHLTAAEARRLRALAAAAFDPSQASPRELRRIVDQHELARLRAERRQRQEAEECARRCGEGRDAEAAAGGDVRRKRLARLGGTGLDSYGAGLRLACRGRVPTPERGFAATTLLPRART
jgi:hypothetical protein